MKIALYQMQILWEDKKANLGKLEKQLKAASEQKVELILLPEMSYTGFSMNTEVTKEEGIFGASVAETARLARKYRIAVGFGWVKACGEKCENHYTVVNKDGEVISDYAKLHPFSYSGEDEKFYGGERLTAFSLEGIPFSGFICYDLRFPEIFQRVSESAHVIMVPANWPARRSHHWKALLQARAIENQVYLLGINCVGMMDGLYYSGDSCVISPDGQILCELHDEEGILICDLSDDVMQYRSTFPVKQDRREVLYRQL